MRELRSEIEIRASADRVWGILTDFARYPEWNPFLRQITGDAVKGAGLTVLFQPSGSGAMTMRPTVTQVRPSAELRWLGHLMVPGLFDGEHIFEIEPRGEGVVRFVQRENFDGLLVPLFWGMLDRDTRRGFTEMNAALKVRAEASQ